jgi:hypothetical protein
MKKPAERIQTGFSGFGSPSWTRIELFFWRHRSKTGTFSRASRSLKLPDIISLDKKVGARNIRTASRNRPDSDAQEFSWAARIDPVNTLAGINQSLK